jgi:hypothetical protein
LIYWSKCTKTHLPVSVVPKNFFRLAIARHEGREREGRGGEGRGEEGRGGQRRGNSDNIFDDKIVFAHPPKMLYNA